MKSIDVIDSVSLINIQDPVYAAGRTISPYRESTIHRSELGLRSRLSERCELLAECQRDDRLVVAALEEGESAAKKRRAAFHDILDVTRCNCNASDLWNKSDS